MVSGSKVCGGEINISDSGTIFLETVATDKAVAAAVEDELNKRVCIETTKTETSNNETSSNETTSLPGVGIFINPAKTDEKNNIVQEKQSLAKNYFNTSDMTTLYPELFKILWESTLPCFSDGDKEHMLMGCEVAGVKVNCSDIFTRIPTDSGMCCALNTASALRASEYADLVSEMQETTATRQVEARVGRTSGLRLTLDLHSNSMSFGTLEKEYEAFSVFIGQPTEFPVVKERSIQLAPGHEHFLDLSAAVVSADHIRGLAAEDRRCYYSDEGNLTFYSNYTLTNCRLECAMLEVERQLGCIPWYLPKVSMVILKFLAQLYPRPPPPHPATLGLPGSSVSS